MDLTHALTALKTLLDWEHSLWSERNWIDCWSLGNTYQLQFKTPKKSVMCYVQFLMNNKVKHIFIQRSSYKGQWKFAMLCKKTIGAKIRYFQMYLRHIQEKSQTINTIFRMWQICILRLPPFLLQTTFIGVGLWCPLCLALFVIYLNWNINRIITSNVANTPSSNTVHPYWYI